eukprot:14800619-Alexandrium_andersonii.AAC.1
MHSPRRTKPLTSERLKSQTMRCLSVLSGLSLVIRASLLIGTSRVPSWARRLSRSSHLTARPWLTVSSGIPSQTPTSSSADR